MSTLYRNFRWGFDGEPQEMLVQDGRVVWRGVPRLTSGAHEVDLGGKYLLPGFIDAHCHILPAGLDLQNLNLTSATSHDEVLALVRDWHARHPEGWLLAVHYEQGKYEGGRHLTRAQLDAISSKRPILLRHANGHASVANSAALAAAGVSESTSDPEGGHYGRDASGTLDGTLFEAAHEHVWEATPMPDLAAMVDAITRAGEQMAEQGIACASDMMTGNFDLEQELQAYALAANRGCPIKMRLYVQWREVFGPRARPLDELRERFAQVERETGGRVRVAGIKIFSDGAIGSATAAIYGRYTGESPSGPVLARGRRAAPAREDVSGQLMYSPERLTEMTRVASDAGFQVAIHAIGDYAVDLVLDAFEATDDPKRHRLEHGTIMGDAQIERLARVGCYLTFQPEFLMRFGTSYRLQLGPERAARLKRTRTVLDAGIPLSFSSDRPIVGGDPWDGILTASHRPEGFDPVENCTREEALRLYTIESARVNGDAERMGALEPGMEADFQLYGEDPLTARRPKPYRP